MINTDADERAPRATPAPSTDAFLNEVTGRRELPPPPRQPIESGEVALLVTAIANAEATRLYALTCRELPEADHTASKTCMNALIELATQSLLDCPKHGPRLVRSIHSAVEALKAERAAAEAHANQPDTTAAPVHANANHEPMPGHVTGAGPLYGDPSSDGDGCG
jgi:hypothetical protein